MLFLGALYLSRGEELKPLRKPLLPLAVAVSVGAALVYGTLGLPAFSDPDAPIHTARRAALSSRRRGARPASRTS